MYILTTWGAKTTIIIVVVIIVLATIYHCIYNRNAVFEGINDKRVYKIRSGGQRVPSITLKKKGLNPLTVLSNVKLNDYLLASRL